MRALRGIGCIVVLAIAASDARAQDFDGVEIRTIPVQGNVAMLVGRGGNLALSSGPDGVFLVDDQFAPLTEKIVAAIERLSKQPVRFVLNTHWHSDHTGGNENFGKRGAVLVAHRNVRTRMSVDQFMEAFKRHVPAAPAGARPIITFDTEMSFHWNGDEIELIHVPYAHTDGDSIARFRKANVLHMGDTFFSGRYPFIDLSSGGSIDGIIAASERGLELADGETKIIPGHGVLSDRAGLVEYRAMLVDLRDRVRDLLAQGKSREAVVAAKPSAAYDGALGGGFVKPDAFVATLYTSLSASD